MDSRKSFGSDNHAGAHESVVRALVQANTGDASAYGADPWTGQATAALRVAFGARGGGFVVFTGTGANVLGLSLLLRPYEAVICPETAHVNVDECGAIERILGNRLLAVATPDGKLTPGLIAPRLEGRGDEHRAQPRVVAISQVTELGTCYTLDDLKALREFCQAEDLRLYVDGARLANAAARLDCSLADLAAQFLGLMEDQLWLHNARHANAMAARLADGIRNVPGVELWQAVEANAVFARLRPAHMARLQQVREFYEWDPSTHVVRWMTAFDTTETDVEAFVADVRQTARDE